MILHHGYTYSRVKKDRGSCRTVRWTCSIRTRYRCTAKLKTLEGVIVAIDDCHNHDRTYYD